MTWKNILASLWPGRALISFQQEGGRKTWRKNHRRNRGRAVLLQKQIKEAEGSSPCCPGKEWRINNISPTEGASCRVNCSKTNLLTENWKNNIQVCLLLANNLLQRGISASEISPFPHLEYFLRNFSWCWQRLGCWWKWVGIVFTSPAGDSPSRTALKALNTLQSLVGTVQHSSCASSGEPGDESTPGDEFCTPRSWAAPASSQYIQLQR